jgi:hypothetical protein
VKVIIVIDIISALSTRALGISGISVLCTVVAAALAIAMEGAALGAGA